MESSPAVTERIEKKVEELERFYPRIIGCHILVETHHRHHHKGRLFHVRIDLKVPGGSIVASRERHDAHEHEDVYVAIRDAFAAVVRQLEDYARRQRGEVKNHQSELR